MPEHFGSLKGENAKEILMKRNTYTCRMSEKIIKNLFYKIKELTMTWSLCVL